jgi:hypothetical protein
MECIVCVVNKIHNPAPADQSAAKKNKNRISTDKTFHGKLLLLAVGHLYMVTSARVGDRNFKKSRSKWHLLS